MHPRLRDDDEAAFELIYGEFLLREELGEPPRRRRAELAVPRVAERLRRQVDLHEVLSVGRWPTTPRSAAGRPPDESDGGARARRAGSSRRGSASWASWAAAAWGRSTRPGRSELKRIVALKVLRADAYADAGAAARFQAEAEAAARFQHPNIVQVYEVGEHEGMGYLVLEYAAGGGLDRRLAETPPGPSRDSRRLIETLARAIHFAHQRGIIHRDLKPANVLLDRGRRSPRSPTSAWPSSWSARTR